MSLPFTSVCLAACIGLRVSHSAKASVSHELSLGESPGAYAQVEWDIKAPITIP